MTAGESAFPTPNPLSPSNPMSPSNPLSTPASGSAPPGSASNAPSRAPSVGADWLARFDLRMARASDWLNPILVKETRQSLKSMQFTITFGLLLVAGWVWSLLGVVAVGQRIYYGAHGTEMFLGYLCILAVPLLVIVPFGAFRSLAAEREDGTFELLSITTLGPRQIVSGKLASAVIQMMIYGSALLPCLAFTYLLRGIDLPTIGTVVVVLMISSVFLSLFGLFCATLTTERHWQVMLSVLLVVALLGACFAVCGTLTAMLQEQVFQADRSEFWLVLGMVFTAYAAYAVLLYFASASMLTFTSGNRSTALRVVMLAHYFLFTSWTAYLWLALDGADVELVAVGLCFVFVHWYVMGVFMTSESPHVSDRVLRKLPNTFLGRVLFSWFFPGPGAGYMNAVGSTWASASVWVAGMYIAAAMPESSNMRFQSPNHLSAVLAFAVLGASYITLYLGLGMLVLRGVRRFTAAPMLLSVLIHVLLVLTGTVVPIVVLFMLDDLGPSMDYSLLQISSPLWTMVLAVERIPRGTVNVELTLALILVPASAACVFLLNLPIVAEEVRRIRIAAPKRVRDDDAETAALTAPVVVPQPTNPWDVPSSTK